MMPSQAKLINENISRNFKGLPETGDTYSYDDAIARYQLALTNAIVKKQRQVKESIYLLKMAWLYRGKAEHCQKIL